MLLFIEATLKSTNTHRMDPKERVLAPCEYKTGRTLGSGSYATVKEAVRVGSDERFAVKMISKKHMRGREDMILNEIAILKRVSRVIAC